jgi:uncharacterized protein
VWRFIVRTILRNRVVILIIIAGLTAFMGYKAREVKLSYEMARTLPANDSTYLRYESFKKQFGEDGSVLFIGIQDRNLFKLDEFNDWFDLSKNIRKDIRGGRSCISNQALQAGEK